LQSFFDLAANGGLTRRCFLGVSVFAAAFLSGCITAGRNDAVRKSVAKAEARIAELKLPLPAPTEPSATLRPAVTAGNLIFVSGHISRAADGKLIMGRVGENLDIAAGKAAARQCGLAILSTLRKELGSLDRVKRVVKVLGMVNCPAGFRDQPAVINGCSELFLEVFGKENGLGARSAVGMSSLPSGVAVEIEAIFEIE
jgi:enamine deaminase RidA (YjgF/YER057c/UK114 family)